MGKLHGDDNDDDDDDDDDGVVVIFFSLSLAFSPSHCLYNFLQSLHVSFVPSR